MGQKTHPLGFRLGITQEHRSAWYANFNQYSNLLEEDDQIRTYLDNLAKAASISNIKPLNEILSKQAVKESESDMIYIKRMNIDPNKK